MPLKQFFLRLIAFGTLPMVVLCVALAGWQVRTEYRDQAEVAERITQNAASALDAELAARISALLVLANSTEALSRNLPAFYVEAQSFRKVLGSHVILAGIDPPQMLVNTRVPFGTPLPMLPRPAGRSAVAEVLATGQPAIGDLFVGPVAGEALLAVAAPVLDKGKPAAILINTIRAQSLQGRLDAVRLPPGGALSLLDSTGAVIASTRRLDGAPPQSSRRIQAPLAAAPWTIALDLDSGAIVQSVVALGLVLLGGIAALAALGFLLVRRAGRQLAHEIDWVTRRAGNRSPPSPQIDEVKAAALMVDAARAKLAESEAFFRALVVGASQAVWRYQPGPDGKGAVDPAGSVWWQEFTGAPLDIPITGATVDWPAAVHPDDRERAQDYWRELATKASGSELRLRVHRRDGNWRWLEIRDVPVVDGHGRLIERAGTIADVTERVNSEAAERQLAAQIASMLDNMSDGFVMFDREWRYRYVNRRAAEMIGRKASELTGQSAWESFPDGVGKPLHRLLLEAAQSQGSYQVETFHEGSVIWYENRILGGPDGVSVYFRDITESKKREASLRDANARLTMLSSRILSTQEAERRHLSRELHDQIGQSLTALKITLQSAATRIEGNGVKTQLARGVEIADSAIAEVRDLSLNLRPPQLDDLGLAAALRWHLERQATIAAIAPHFEDAQTPRRLPEPVAVTAYRIAQEAITNVLRHAGAQNLWLTIGARDRQLDLEIRDDGCGFAAAGAGQPRSVGLTSMRERAALIGGTLHVDSAPGAGTRVRAELPIGDADADASEAP